MICVYCVGCNFAPRPTPPPHARPQSNTSVADIITQQKIETRSTREHMTQTNTLNTDEEHGCIAGPPPRGQAPTRGKGAAPEPRGQHRSTGACHLLPEHRGDALRLRHHISSRDLNGATVQSQQILLSTARSTRTTKHGGGCKGSLATSRSGTSSLLLVGIMRRSSGGMQAEHRLGSRRIAVDSTSSSLRSTNGTGRKSIIGTPILSST